MINITSYFISLYNVSLVIFLRSFKNRFLKMEELRCKNELELWGFAMLLFITENIVTQEINHHKE